MNKFLTTGLLAAVTALSATAEGVCSNGSFYAGVSLGASFNKANVKGANKSEYTSYFEKLAKDLIAKVTECTTTADEAASKITDDQIKALATAISGILNEIYGASVLSNTQTTYAAVSGYAAGSLNAIKAGTATDEVAQLVKFLCSYDSSISDNNASVDYKISETMFVTAVKNILKAGKLSELVTYAKLDKFTTGSTTLNFTVGSASISKDLTAANTAYTAINGAKASGSETTYVTIISEAIAKRAEILNTYKKAVSSSFESNSGLKSIFYSDAKTEYDTSTLAGVTSIVQGIEKYSTDEGNTLWSDFGFNDNGKASKKATGFIAGVFFGFDHRIGDCMIGIDANVEFDAGGKAKIKSKSATKGIEVKRQFGFSVMPRVGIMITPQLEGFVTFGGNLSRYSVNTSNMLTILNSNSKLMPMATAYNALDLAKNSQIALDSNSDLSKIFKNHKKTKFGFAAGAGMKYDITPDMFVKLSYVFNFKTKIGTVEKQGAEVKFQSHVIKVGLGYRF